MIVDDEQIVHESVIDVLEDEGYELCSAYNGEEGIKLYELHKSSLIILDLRMPGMNGIQFLEKLGVKTDDPFSVIVLTGHGDVEDMEKTYDLWIRSFFCESHLILILKS